MCLAWMLDIGFFNPNQPAPLAYIDPDGLEPLTIGSYNDLTDEQKRLFQTYVNNNYADQIGDMDPGDFAARLWNESALIANTEGENAAVVGGALTQSQLTTFLGVTSMLESRGVSDQVLSITAINGDQKEHNFRVYSELKGADSYKEIYKAFDWKIGGSGHEPYTNCQGAFPIRRSASQQFPKLKLLAVPLSRHLLLVILTMPIWEELPPKRHTSFLLLQ